MIVFYADGSKEKGYGHLYRLLKIYQSYFKDLNVIFIYSNKTQKSFYENNFLKHTSYKEFLNIDKHIDLLVVDTKEDHIKHISNIIDRASKKIAIDSLKEWISEFDYLIFPSFYFDMSYIDQQKITSEILYGEKFCIPPRISKKEHKFKKILVTFGGSDPNDLSSIILEQLNLLGILEETRLIVGPGFQKKKNYFIKKYDGLSVVGPVKETISYIRNSEIIFTSLGTTVQEVEFLDKFGAILFNYDTDQDDFDMIRLKSSNKNRWHSLGSYKKPNLDEIKEILQSHDNIDNSIESTKEWGSGWNEFIKHINI